MSNRRDVVWRHQTRAREREVAAKNAARRRLADRKLSSAERVTKYAGPRADATDSEPYERGRFRRDDPESAAWAIEDFAEYWVGASNRADFERGKRHALSCVDSYLPPSAFREEVHETIQAVEWIGEDYLFDVIRRSDAARRLTTLAESIRAGAAPKRPTRWYERLH